MWLIAGLLLFFGNWLLQRAYKAETGRGKKVRYLIAGGMALAGLAILFFARH